MFIFMECLGVNNTVENIVGPCVEMVLSPSTNEKTESILVLRRGTLFKVSQAQS
jgi:hypothetical protein